MEAMAAIIKDGIARLDDELLIRAFLSGGDAFDRSEGVFAQPRFFVIFDPLDTPPASAYNNGVALEPIDDAGRALRTSYNQTLCLTTPDAIGPPARPGSKEVKGVQGLHLTADLYACQCAPQLMTDPDATADMVAAAIDLAGLEVPARTDR